MNDPYQQFRNVMKSVDKVQLQRAKLVNDLYKNINLSPTLNIINTVNINPSQQALIKLGQSLQPTFDIIKSTQVNLAPLVEYINQHQQQIKSALKTLPIAVEALEEFSKDFTDQELNEIELDDFLDMFNEAIENGELDLTTDSPDLNELNNQIKDEFINNLNKQFINEVIPPSYSMSTSEKVSRYISKVSEDDTVQFIKHMLPHLATHMIHEILLLELETYISNYLILFISCLYLVYQSSLDFHEDKNKKDADE